MKLSSEQQDAIKREYGIFANEACDSCGKVLGSVRYIRRNELGEWCSEFCRDGAAEVEARSARRAGRPRKHQDSATRQRAYRARLGALRNTRAPY